MEKPTIVERFADNGEHSHWEMVRTEDGYTLWSEEEDHDKIVVKTTACYNCPFHVKAATGGVMKLWCKAMGNLELASNQEEIDAMDMFNPDVRCPLIENKIGTVRLVPSSVYPNWKK